MIENATAVTNYDGSRFNALKLGLRARRTVLPWEDVTDFEDFADVLKKEYLPETSLECLILQEITETLWRKRRIAEAEKFLFSEMVKYHDPNQGRGSVFPLNPKMRTLTRYEAHLDRKLQSGLAMLIRLQEMRANPKD
jgi:hypothetical protein